MTRKNVLLTGAVLGCAAAYAQEMPLDFWDEALRTFSTAPAGQHIDVNLEVLRRRGQVAGVALDHSDKKVGDLSLVYRPAQSQDAKTFGFVANIWGGTWVLTADMALKLHVKATGESNPDQWEMLLMDQSGKIASATIKGTDTKGEWRELILPLGALTADDGFDWSAVTLCEFEADFGGDSELRFDGVRFEGAGRFVGVTDKPVSQRMAEAESNREFRMNHAIRVGSMGGHSKAVQAFCKMYLNEDLETANQWLAEDLAAMIEQDPWSLLSTPLYCRFYFWFSSRAGKFPGRMKPAVEEQLLATIWARTESKNDIAWAKQSTWWMDGSENHDLNARASVLVSSRIFMNEPAYKDRVYPNYGFGGGYRYGPSSYIGPGIDPATRHAGGRADLKDGKAYTAADHYEAWLANLKAYFRERTKRGFLLENWSNGYTKHTLNMVDLAYQYSGDEELKQIIGDFLTIYWADWAQKAISGVHGGPKTRHQGVGGYDSTAEIVTTYLGGAGNGGIWWYWNLVNDYRLPAVVWLMALDREGMGAFSYLSRGIGEEQNLWPRPPGAERTLICDTDSRFLKYTHVTPDYTLGSQMDHPAAVHSHLSAANRWQGMTFAHSPASRIVPVSYPDRDNPKPNTGNLFFNAQHRDVLIVQLARNYLRISPTWFPGDRAQASGNPVIAIYIGTDWDQVVERDGWIFVQKGKAYAAIRPVLWDEVYETERSKKGDGTQQIFNSHLSEPTVKLRTDCYKWSKDKTMIELDDPYSPVIIQAGRKAEYPTLEAFVVDVLGNPVALYKTVVPGFHILTYTGSGPDAREIVFNAGTGDIPTIGGKPVDYEYPMTFDSPYLKSDYKSGIVKIKYGKEALTLDFTDQPDGIQRGCTGVDPLAPDDKRAVWLHDAALRPGEYNQPAHHELDTRGRSGRSSDHRVQSVAHE